MAVFFFLSYFFLFHIILENSVEAFSKFPCIRNYAQPSEPHSRYLFIVPKDGDSIITYLYIN
jgi:hypothetical protein